MPRLSLFAAGAALAALLALPAALPAQRPTTLAGRSTVYAPHGIVATSQPLASEAGLEVLRHGGNAVDAAVTAAAVLSVTEPHMTGIGGDMFAIVWLAKARKLVALNASGRAGSLMKRETLQARGFRPGSQQGAMSVTVPGALAGWDLLLRTQGRRTLAQALEPAIAYARDGFPVSPIIAAQWAGETAFLQRDSAAAATFLPAAARRRRASGSGTPTTRVRCRRSPTTASAPSMAARSAGASWRVSRRWAASSPSPISQGTSRPG